MCVIESRNYTPCILRDLSACSRVFMKRFTEEVFMCLAIPMRVLEIKGVENELAIAPTALVEMDGLRQEVRLDIIDRWPEPGEFVIVHAGFAIHALSAEEAEINLSLMRRMAEGLDD